MASFPLVGDWLDEVGEAITWLVPGVIQSGGLNLLSGHGKRSYKTFLALHLGFALAYQRSALGQPNFQRKQRILFLEEEGTKADLKQRIRAVMAGFGLDKEDLAKGEFFWSFKNQLRLDNDDSRKRVVVFCLEHKVDFVVCDSLSSMFAGDENEAKEVNKAIYTLRELQSNGATVLLLAHLKKVINPKEDIDEHVRGSSQLITQYDTHIAIRTREIDETSGRVSLGGIIRPRVDEERRFTLEHSFKKDAEDNTSHTVGIHFQEEREHDHDLGTMD